MAKLHKFVDTRDEQMYMFECPGCGCSHWVRVRGEKPCWQWNGSLTAPTFGPSIDVCSQEPERRCHSVITDGNMTFFEHSFHKLAGQTVRMPEWDHFLDD